MESGALLMFNLPTALLVIFCLTAVKDLMAADITVPIYLTMEQGNAKPVGSVLIQSSKYGILFTPNLNNLTPGLHGFHIHQNASCEQNGMAAGGHLDPKQTNKHLGPYSDHGHLGDLPAIYVTSDGSATLPVLAPRLNHLADLRNHSLMIHEGGDNYRDEPTKLGGGGTRMACGVIG